MFFINSWKVTNYSENLKHCKGAPIYFGRKDSYKLIQEIINILSKECDYIFSGIIFNLEDELHQLLKKVNHFKLI